MRYAATPGASPSEEVVEASRLVRSSDPAKSQLYAPSQPVFGEWHGVLMPGKVAKESGKGQYRVGFEGKGPESDEFVASSRIRPRA